MTITYTTITPWTAKAEPLAVQRAKQAVNSAPPMTPAPAAPHGIEDDGYADSDDTSRILARIERFPA